MSILVLDIETVPDLAGFARAHSMDDQDRIEIRKTIGSDFPKHIYHAIVCIGALAADWTPEGWKVHGLIAPHIGEISEARLIKEVVTHVEQTLPTFVTFNGCQFDLPVLRYRAMIHGIPAPAFSRRKYFHRFGSDAVDLCDVLASYQNGAKATLDEISKIMGLPGKPDGLSGANVEEYVNSGRIAEVADYCKRDVLNTYRLRLRYELFRGELSEQQFRWSDEQAKSLAN